MTVDATTEAARAGQAKKARAPRSEGERFVWKLELTNAALVLIASAVLHLIFGAGPMLYGALVGGLIGILNLRAMIFLGRRILFGKRQGKLVYVILFGLKLGVLCTVVWLALANLPIHSIGFLIGFSTLLPAVLVATALKSLERPPESGERRP